ncbi:ATP-binding cassette domain-containing protein [Sporosarcina thermotolerans]|uniref:ATP-binding cassette domain-containing protein n=2 Tax=Sporosarcina thermotolerans TaxID=633404 RepID=A0AAW9A9A6_9BACL|nr:ATP-binding cassette domain-containing protein [Sporosarcina thermotolerans]MDW0117772.1 ATP-binding cassette domain-containing protein [Sporosarcina thermotolerans]
MGSLNQPIIEIKDVHYQYPGAKETVLNGASLTINKGDFLAIIGGNGSGKSTICKTINGLIPHYFSGDYNGEVIVNGLSVKEQPVSILSHHVGYVYQDFQNQLMKLTVLEDVGFSPLNFGYPDYEEKAMWALELLGIEHLKDKTVWELSGGQQHLTALAGALALNPEILIIDEPVAQLDPQHATLIYDKLQYLNEELGKTIIVIEHHTEFIANYCKHVALIENGQVKWHTDVKQGLLNITELEDVHIYPPQVTQAALQIASFSNSDELPITVDEAKDYFKDYFFDPGTDSNQANLHSTDSAILSIKDVRYEVKTLQGERRTVLDIDALTFFEGERVAIVGNNGAGKTTLMKSLAGINKPRKGEIIVDGIDVMRAPVEKLSSHISYIYQNPEEMFIQDTIQNDVTYFGNVRNLDRKELYEQIADQLNLHALLPKDGRLLSGGQQRRSSVAIGLAMMPTVMMLDEPTASLDVGNRKQLIRILHSIRDRVKTVLIATHDMQLVSEWATRVIVMEHGKVVFDGTPRALFERIEVWKSAGLKLPQIAELSLELNIHPALSVEEFVGRVKEVQVIGANG